MFKKYESAVFKLLFQWRSDKGRGWEWVTPLSVDSTRVSYLISCNPIEGYGFLLREVQRVEINSLQDY